MGALAFTSPNGVAVFADLTPDRSLPVFAVGDATAERARQAGFGHVTSASGALADLAWLIAGAAVGKVLVPGAREPAGDLDALLDGAVETVILPVYEAMATGAKPPQAFDAVLAHSPRAAQAVAEALGRNGGARRLAVAISAAAAAPLAAAGFAEIRTAGAPTDAAVLLALGNPAARV
jgi:uroporphyrinogen-III synthase